MTGNVYVMPEGGDPDDPTAWRPLGSLSEDGFAFKSDLAAYAEGSEILPVIHRQVPITEATWSDEMFEFHQRLYPPSHYEITRNGVQEYIHARAKQRILTPLQRDRMYPEVLEAIIGETEQGVLKRRLNARWKHHRHPDSQVLLLEHTGYRQFYPHVFVKATDTGFDVDPIPVPSKDDPDYYLRNP